MRGGGAARALLLLGLDRLPCAPACARGPRLTSRCALERARARQLDAAPDQRAEPVHDVEPGHAEGNATRRPSTRPAAAAWRRAGSSPPPGRCRPALPTTPPALWRSTPGCQCSVASPQLRDQQQRRTRRRAPAKLTRERRLGCAAAARQAHGRDAAACQRQQVGRAARTGRTARRRTRRRRGRCGCGPASPSPVEEKPGSRGIEAQQRHQQHQRHDAQADGRALAQPAGDRRVKARRRLGRWPRNLVNGSSLEDLRSYDLAARVAFNTMAHGDRRSDRRQSSGNCT